MSSLASILCGFAVGLLMRGRLAGLRIDRLRFWPLLPLGIALAATNAYAGGSLGLVLGLTGAGVLAVVAASNLKRLHSSVLVLAGICLNLVPITADGGMPVSPSALATARGWSLARVFTQNVSGYHHLQRPGDRFMALADILPVGALHTVMSAGDVALSVGFAAVVAEMMLRPVKRGVLSPIVPVHPGRTDLPA